MEPRAVAWTGAAVRLLDQTLLPHRVEYRDCHEVDAVVEAIRRLVVRGAPALGAAGAYGVAVAVLQAERYGWDRAERDAAILRLREARPTAVNLAWAVDRVRPAVEGGVRAVVAEAERIVQADSAANRAIGCHGADWLAGRVPTGRPLRILTHCNTGALATTGWGTALGVVRELNLRGRLEQVYVDETRPLLQGARLTAWELQQAGIDYRLQPDSAVAGTVLGGVVDAAVVGADRIAANGDTANKVGTLGVALACADAGIPFVVAAPTSTRDPAASTGADIAIEYRAEEEVLGFAGVGTAPAGSRAHNPAFDVTPARLISAVITEDGVWEPTDTPAM